MAIALVQKNHANALASGGSVTLPGSTTSGNTIVIQIETVGDTGTPTFSIANYNGTAFGSAVTITNGNQRLQQFYAYNITGGASPSFTITSSGGTPRSMGVSVEEYSGLTTTDPLDKTATGNPSFGGPYQTSATATLSQATELVVAAISDQAGNSTWSAGSGYTPNDSFVSGGAEHSLSIYKTVSATTAVQATWTVVNDDSAICVVATYLGAPSSTLEQNAYRWRNDDGSETTATWAANQNTDITKDRNINVRLRFILNSTLDYPSSAFKLKYKKSTSNDWIDVPTGGGAVTVSASSNIASGGEATTAQLTAPSGKTTSDFTTGREWDDENGSDSIDIASGQYTELEWCLQLQSPAVHGDYYQFRVYNGDTAIDTYTVTPQIQVQYSKWYIFGPMT